MSKIVYVYIYWSTDKRNTNFGIRGETSQNAFISSFEASASIKRTSAPASAKALDLQSASFNDRACRASVLATMTISEPLSNLASIAALIRITASSLDTTFLPFVWPHAFGDI